jgi:hypothetical protein
MNRLSKLAVVPIAAAATILGAGAAVAAPITALAPGDSCSATYTSVNRTVTVRCGTVEPGTEFQAVAHCPGGGDHFGPWVLQGPGHVSVANCANPMTEPAGVRFR